MKSKIFQLYLHVFLSILIFTGCVSEFEEVLEQRDAISFDLQLTPNGMQKSSMDKLNVSYLLAKKDGRFIHEVQSTYLEESGKIVMEPLPLGEYNIYILAYNKQLLESGLNINRAPSSVDDRWFFFENNEIPILPSGELYYTSYTFDVTTEAEVNFSVELAPVLSFVHLKKEVPSVYLQNSIRDIRMSVDNKWKSFSEFTVAGNFQGEASYVSQQSITDCTNYFFMPQAQNEPISFNFHIETVNHKNDAYHMHEVAELTLDRGMRVELNLDLSKHPDSKNGMLYISKSFYNQEDRGLILQDDEPKAIFYNKKERSFKTNQPLQFSIIDTTKLQSRFYSPVPIKEVTVWSSDKIYGERVLLAYYDSIPAFCDARFSFSKEMPLQEFTLESKSKIQLSQTEVRTLIASGLEFECQDPYMQKIYTIKHEWYVFFDSYGGDPDAFDGAPAGNWMGIRPVHIRELIAAMTNISYMISTPEFESHLMGFQGQIWGNGGKDSILDVSVILPQLRNLYQFKMGLCYYTAGTVVGLGGNGILGVAQNKALWHYDDHNATRTFFHEMGHMMGYSHSSGMTYGPWAEKIANHYYVNNIASFPVSDYRILNGRNNPNIYVKW